MGLTTGVIDLRGHGEHDLDMDGNILSDLEIAYLTSKDLEG